MMLSLSKRCQDNIQMELSIISHNVPQDLDFIPIAVILCCVVMIQYMFWMRPKTYDTITYYKTINNHNYYGVIDRQNPYLDTSTGDFHVNNNPSIIVPETKYESDAEYEDMLNVTEHDSDDEDVSDLDK